MHDVVYIGASDAVVERRLSLLAQHQLDAVSYSEAVGRVRVLDASHMSDDEAESQIAALAGADGNVLVLFRLSHGVSFRARREALMSIGAADVMDADAPDEEFLTRVRARLLASIPPRVLIVEDDTSIGAWAAGALAEIGMETTCVETLAAARERFETGPVDALVVDRQLPDGDGLAFVALLRDQGIRTPALLFTALGDIEERVRGLEEARADDYICKPVHADELCARVRLLLRPRITEETLFFGPLEINRKDRVIKWRGDRIELRPKECAMLIYLAERAGLPIPQRMIYLDVWGKVFMDIGSNPITSARRRLVQTIKAFLEERGEPYPDFLETIGSSYVFQAAPLLKLASADAAV